MKVLGPTSGSPARGSGQGTRNPQGIWLWRPVGFDYRASIGLGETRDSWRTQTKSCAYKSQRKGGVTHTEHWVRPTCGCWGSPVEAWTGTGLPRIQGHSKPSWRSPVVLLQKPIDSRTGSPQAKQLTGGGSTAPSISRQVYSSFTEHIPAHQTKTQFPPQPVPPIRKLIQASYSQPPEGRQKK